jgi:hypothetical protein
VAGTIENFKLLSENLDAGRDQEFHKNAGVATHLLSVNCL